MYYHSFDNHYSYGLQCSGDSQHLDVSVENEDSQFPSGNLKKVAFQIILL